MNPVKNWESIVRKTQIYVLPVIFDSIKTINHLKKSKYNFASKL